MEQFTNKSLFNLISLIFCAFLSVQCVEKQEEPYLTAETTKVEAEASQTLVVLAFDSNTQWKVTAESSWLSTGGIKYGEGNGLLELTLLENGTTDERKCEVTVTPSSASLAPLKFEVVQYGTDPVLSIAADTLEVPQVSGTETVKVTSNVDFKVVVEAEWLSVRQDQGSLIISYSENDVTSVREGKIVVVSEAKNVSDTVVVVQEARTPAFLRVQSDLSLDYGSGTENVAVETNVEYEVKTEASWLTISKTAKGIAVEYEANNDPEPRSAKITFRTLVDDITAEMAVAQEGKPLSKRQADSLALVTFYNNTNGESWKNKWDLSAPMNEWYGVNLTEEGRVWELNLWENNISGDLGDCLTVLEEAGQLHFSGNNLTGTLSPKFANLKKMRLFSIAGNNMEGSIPAEFGSMVNLENFYLDNNRFSGEIPQEIFDNPNWKRWEEFGFRRQQEGYGFTN